MKKKLLSVTLAMVMALTLFSCGKETAGGLGQLSISSDSKSSKSEVPDLGGGKSSSSTSTSTETSTSKTEDNSPTSVPDTPTSVPEPSPEPTPTPAPQTGLQTTYFNGAYFSGYVPDGWTINSQAYDDGTGNYRLAMCIYDPTDYNNQITFFTALEPFWISQSDKNLMAPYLGTIGPYCPVINELNATAVFGQWGNVYTCLNLTDITYPKVSATVPNFSIVEVAGASDPVNQNGFIVSDMLAACSVPGASQQYAVYFCDNLGKLNFSGITYYTSYMNYIISARLDVYETYLPVLVECASSFDYSAFNEFNQKKKRGISADVSSNDDLAASALTSSPDLSTLNFK